MKRFSTGSKNNLSSFVLTGPTGSGKTQFILDHYSDEAEVISIDSVMVYKGLDIGSSKPTKAERERVPHHLVDVLEIDEQMNLGMFLNLAQQAAQIIQQKNKRMIVSGGTIYYLRHYLFGVPQTPKADLTIREKVNQLETELGKEGLYQLLLQHDLTAGQKIHSNDIYRIKRALEVFFQTGHPLSSFSSMQNETPNLPILILDIEREELKKRIRERCLKMFDQGWVEEVQSVLKSYPEKNCPGLKSIGYAEISRDLKQGKDPRNSIDEIILRTYQLAKRQITFLRSIKFARWVSPRLEDVKRALFEFDS